MKFHPILTSILLSTIPISVNLIFASSTSNHSTAISASSSALSSKAIHQSWISSSFGLMLEDNHTISAFTHQDLHSLHKRDSKKSSSSNARASKRVTRDIARKSLLMGLNQVGDLLWTEENLYESIPQIGRRGIRATTQKKKSHQNSSSTLSKMTNSWKKFTNGKNKKTAKGKKTSITTKNVVSQSAVKFSQIAAFRAVITWYNGNGLNNPYCAQGSKWTPTDNSMIAAVTEKWGANRPSCGSFLQLRTAGSPTTIIVRVVDLCGGCKAGVPHVDLSQSAFKKLYALNIGEVQGIEVSTLGGNPVGVNWNDEELYGPETL